MKLRMLASACDLARVTVWIHPLVFSLSSMFRRVGCIDFSGFDLIQIRLGGKTEAIFGAPVADFGVSRR